MKALLFCYEFPPDIGGIAQFSNNIANWLSDGGIDFTVLIPYQKGRTSNSYAVHSFRFPRNSAMRILFSAIALFKELMVNKYDLILITDMRAMNMYSRLLLFLPRNIISIFHGGEILLHLKEGRWRFVRKYFMRQLVANSICAVTVSSFVKDLIVEQLGISAEKVHVIHNGIDTSEFKCKDEGFLKCLRKKYGLNGKQVIITVSRLIRDKNHRLVLETLAKRREEFRDLRYIIVGNGPENDEIKSLVRRYGLEETVIFFGKIGINDPRKPCLYELADVYVMPSLRETFGISFLECAAVGLPAIGSRIGGVSRVIKDGMTGFLIEPNEFNLYQKLKELLGSTKKRKVIGENAQKAIEDEFGKEITTRRWKALLVKSVSMREKKANKPVRIIHLITKAGIGGAEKALLRTLKRFKQKDMDHVVITLLSGGKLWEQFRDAGIEIHTLNVKNPFDIRAFFKYIKFLNEIKPKIVVAYLFHALTVAVLGKILCNRHKLVHSKRNFTLDSKIRDTMNRLYCCFIDYLIGVSKGVFEKESKIKFRDGRNKYLVYNGIEMPPKNFIKKGKGTFTVGTIARLHRQKGLLYLLGAARIIMDLKKCVKFIIIGTGEQYYQLKRYIVKNHLENYVEMKGEVLNPVKYYEEFDIFLLPSLYEGFSNVILEALAYGIPVVGTNACGINEIIRDGINGILIKPKSADAIAEAILKLMEDKDLQKRLGKEGKRTISAKFTINKTVEKLEGIFNTILRERIPY
jgi:glycosyltransferase involved in cell wall biosynthesis